MAITGTSSELYDVADFKVFQLVSDSTGSPSPTYGNAIDVPGIAAVTLDPQYVSAVLKGDNGVVLAARSKVDSFQVSFTYDKLDLDALAAFYGGAVVAKTDKTGWGLPIGGTMPYFGAACSILDVATDEGIFDVHCYWYKCQLTGGQILNVATEKFSQPTGQFTAFHCKSNIALDQFFELCDVVTPLAMVTPYIT